MYDTKGTHYTLDLWGIDENKLDDLNYIENLLTEAVKRTGATILDKCSYKFQPQGCTAMLLLSESHCTAHCYSEANFAAICLFTCGSHVDTKAGIDYIIEQLQPEDFEIKKIRRGVRGT